MGQKRRALVQKAQRLEAKFGDHRRSVAQQHHVVASLWNAGRLRRGDCLRGAGTVARQQSSWQHRNSWTIEGTLDT
eukprot:1391587-Prorocentrum_lima.AAC.1